MVVESWSCWKRNSLESSSPNTMQWQKNILKQSYPSSKILLKKNWRTRIQQIIICIIRLSVFTVLDTKKKHWAGPSYTNEFLKQKINQSRENKKKSQWSQVDFYTLHLKWTLIQRQKQFNSYILEINYMILWFRLDV